MGPHHELDLGHLRSRRVRTFRASRYRMPADLLTWNECNDTRRFVQWCSSSPICNDQAAGQFSLSGESMSARSVRVTQIIVGRLS
jgi:hypothetical protein